MYIKDVNDNKFTIERVVGTQNIQIDWTYYSNNAWRLFGFENKETSASNILKSPHPVDKSTHFVDLVIPEIPLIACKKNSIGKNVIERIPLSSNSGNISIYKPNIEEYFSQNYFYPIKLDRVTIELYDESSNKLFDTQDYNNSG